ncbi:MAG: toll/interleukin-1 receptor domain-containing protein [Chloroflexi bacterium]|nr:toll/interleukin-1 receptor domain-containing protein [Chloroflexota bacterium]
MYPDFLDQPPFNLPLPTDEMLRIKRLARDLAYGALYKKWSHQFGLDLRRNLETIFKDNIAYFLEGHEDLKGFSRDLTLYLYHVWEGNIPSLETLAILGYLEDQNPQWKITSKAYSLLEEPNPQAIFISYRRQSSSALAMLIASELHRAGYQPFIDISNIYPGDQWHGLIEKEVKKSTVFIVVIGLETLEKSKPVREEIKWAVEDTQNRRIIPILHGGYSVDDLEATEFGYLKDYSLIPIKDDVSAEIESALSAIRMTLGL